MPSVKREYTSSEEESLLNDHKPDIAGDTDQGDSDFEPTPSPLPKKAKASTDSSKAKTKSATSTPQKKTKRTDDNSSTPDLTPKKAGSTASPGGKKMGSWSGDELKTLYTIMCPKRVGVNWSDIAGQIPGRDAKACQNKWARMQGKLMQAIEDLGE
ncbi:hypothetical protein IAU59_000908 [Kwoniella sp. CBS 9459]